MDGTLIVYDKERDDAAFVPEESHPLVSHSKGSDKDHRPLLVKKSVNSRNQKSNPVASWKISNHRINDLAFSPDCRHLAVVTEDGFLHIIDYLNEQCVVSPPLHHRNYVSLRPRLIRPKQTQRYLPQLLRRLPLCLLVPRRQIHFDRRTGRPSIHLVPNRTPARGPMSRAPLLGQQRCIRPLAMRRAKLPLWQRGRGSTALALGFQRRDAASTQGGQAQYLVACASGEAPDRKSGHDEVSVGFEFDDGGECGWGRDG